MNNLLTTTTNPARFKVSALAIVLMFAIGGISVAAEDVPNGPRPSDHTLDSPNHPDNTRGHGSDSQGSIVQPPRAIENAPSTLDKLQQRANDMKQETTDSGLRSGRAPEGIVKPPSAIDRERDRLNVEKQENTDTHH